MKLYKIKKSYGEWKIYEMCWANDEADVYTILDWNKEDIPKLKIEEIKEKRGCFLSLTHHERLEN